MTEKEYLDYAKFLWKTYVPKSGQADYVQGELMRAIEKLKYEALDNGNINWGEYYEMLVNYIKEILLEATIFSVDQKNQIKEDINKILDFEHPATSNKIFVSLRNRIVDWCLANKEPIAHNWNPDLDDLE
jgi:hypothetical protein